MKVFDGETIINMAMVRNRDKRAYTRGMRHRAISKKKRIAIQRDGSDWHKHDGQYSKGKIHCGCPTCKFSKACHLPTLRTIKEKERFSSAVKDYIS